MTSMEHRTDLVEAYALGALDPADQADMESHLQVCAECRSLAQTSTDVANMLSLVARPMEPPLRCKRTVLERIERDAFLRAPTPRRAQRRVPLSAWAAMAAVLALMVTGGWAATLQTRLAQAQNQLAHMSTQATQMAQQQAESYGQLANFSSVLADGEKICRMAEGPAKATCYARAGDRQGVMIVSGLAPLPEGKAYQLWLANDQEQLPLNVFNTRQDGTQNVLFAPQQGFDPYTAIMVTVEDANGAQQPSDEIVLDGEF